MYARNNVGFAHGASPTDGVTDDPLYVFILIGRIGFVSGLEIEDLAVSAGKGTAAAENLSAIEPTDKNNLVGIRDIERFAVHFFILKKESVLHTLGNRMIRLNRPDPLARTVAPFEIAGRTHETLEYLGMMSRVENDESHAAENSLLYAVNDLVADPRVTHMSPPEKNVRIRQNFFGQTVLGHIERCRADLDIVTFDHAFQITVDTARI